MEAGTGKQERVGAMLIHIHQLFSEPINNQFYDRLLEPRVVAMSGILELIVVHRNAEGFQSIVKMLALHNRDHLVICSMHDEKWRKSGLQITHRACPPCPYQVVVDVVALISPIGNTIQQKGLRRTWRLVIVVNFWGKALINRSEVCRTEDVATSLCVG